MNKYIFFSLFTAVGLLLGFAYWYFVGCTEGCAITSIWYRSSLYGGVMGFLSGGIFHDFFKPKS